MIYIIGVDHLIQYDNGIVPAVIFREFSEYIAGKVRILDVKLLAEEFSLEALHDVYDAHTATVKAVADSLGIEHRFCDPEEKDRIRLGIPYFADIRDRVRVKYGIAGNSSMDFTLRKKTDDEASEISKEFWVLREGFWFDRIRDRVDSGIIFVCGHEHVDRFRDLLTGKDVECGVLDPFWRKEIFSDYDALLNINNGKRSS